ncbi:MAG: cation transporter [Gammaproteobacteria bacterium]
MSTECGCCTIDPDYAADRRRRRVLYIVLGINLAMFGFELAAGLWAGSTALQADALDMLADALVYVISLLAITRGGRARAFAGLSNGVLEGLLGLAVLAQVAWHAIAPLAPVGAAIMIVAAIAMAANVFCAALLLQFRHEDINMRAVWLCTRNDALGNAGTILAGALVIGLHSKWPDLIVGTALAVLLIRTATRVGREAVRELRRAKPTMGEHANG